MQLCDGIVKLTHGVGNRIFVTGERQLCHYLHLLLLLLLNLLVILLLRGGRELALQLLLVVYECLLDEACDQLRVVPIFLVGAEFQSNGVQPID